MADAPTVWTIPAGVPFVDAMAAELLHRARDNPEALGALTVLLPNRRAGRSLREAFLRRSGAKALILPRLRPLGEVDEDELAVLDADLAEDDAEIPPAIAPLRRTLLLARLVLKAGPAVAGVHRLDQAMRLGAELGRLIDEAHTAGLTFDRMADLVPEAHADHWQSTLRFLAIATEHWPRILAAEGRIDAADRRNRLLAGLAARWREHPPRDPVIAAGSTGSIPATADVLTVVARLPSGEVVLPGLDRDADDATWNAVGDTHPQAGLKRLLDHLGIGRRDVRPWPVAADLRSPVAVARGRLLADALRPSATVARWRDAEHDDAAAAQGMVRVDGPSPQVEAGVIALCLRDALETPGRTAALVTRDRRLAERVATELARWGIAIDDSAGVALATTPVGAFLRLTADMALSRQAPLALLAALKHPLAAGGQAPGAFRANARRLELAALRGPRPAPGFAGVAAALRQHEAPADLRRWFKAIGRAAAPFQKLIERRRIGLGDVVREHVRFAEELAATDAGDGAGRLWAQESGEAAATLLADLIDQGAALPEIAGVEYGFLLDIFLAAVAVRPRYGAHPRLAIWGPLEARLQRADVMIVGGLNEGSWPPEAARDPWLSRPMRAAFGLPSRERRIGQAAHDFVQAAAAPEVMLTRAAKVDGTPTVAARYLARLETMLAARGSDNALRVAGDTLLGWRANYDRPARIAPIPRPRHAPPLATRPRRLSVTQIEPWIRDPYAIYARWILGLGKLDPLDADPGAAERGTFVHRALERFVRTYPTTLPGDAVDRLIAMGLEIAGDALAHPGVRAFWWPRFQRIADWFVANERVRRITSQRILVETKGTLTLDLPAGPFTLSATADRLDVFRDGTIAVIDYKTGGVPTQKDVMAGVSPQLSLEAAIAAAGGFSDLTGAAGVSGSAGATVSELAYWKLTGGHRAGEITRIPGGDGLVPEAARDGLDRLVRAFDDPAMPYLVVPRPDFEPAFNDYEHLERREEWTREQPSTLPPFRPVRDSVARGVPGSLPDQRRMSDPGTSAWIAASAGTGKTKVLTDRVLRLLLGGAEARQVLCLTFTKAAAAEMASRVERQLGTWTIMADDALVAALRDLTGSPPDPTTLARARTLFAATIEAPGGLQIMTIHGFCQSLLGRFPLEAGVAPGFDVADERTAAELQRQAHDTVLAGAASDTALADAVAVVARHAGDLTFAKLAGAFIADRARFQEALRRHGGHDRLIMAIRDHLGVAADTTIESLVTRALADDAFDGHRLVAAARALAASKAKTDQARGLAMLPWLLATPAQRGAIFDAYADQFITKDGTIRARLATKPVVDGYPDLVRALEVEAARLDRLQQDRQRAETAEASAALVRLGDALIRVYQEIKSTHGLLDYDDLILGGAALVTRSGQAAWVLYKLDGGLDHILVDEAQDTSPVQWRLIGALVEEFFAGAGARETARTLFVVGDAKQSIFSFQGADLETLVKVRADLAARARAAGVPWLEWPMERSFRSSAPILEAVDAVFAAPAARAGVADGGVAVRHEINRVGQAGLVELWPIVAAGDAASEDPWTPARDYVERDDPGTRLAERVADTIQGFIEGKERLPARDRPIGPGDIMILVQRRGRFLGQMVGALQRRNVPVAGVDRMRLDEPLAVRDLIALGRALLLPEDDLNLASVLRGPLIGFDEETLFAIAHGRRNGASLWQALAGTSLPAARAGASSPAARVGHRYLSRLLAMTDYAAPFTLFSHVLTSPPAMGEATSGRAALLGRLGLEAEDLIDEFLALAQSHALRRIPSLEAFLHWIEAGEAEIKRDPEHGRDEVQVITVHGAKGLQRPIVFLPETTRVPPNFGGRVAWAGAEGRDRADVPLWIGQVQFAAPELRAARDATKDRELAEYRRLLYVALTRAEDRLYVAGWMQRRAEPGQESWYHLVRSALEPLAQRFAFDGWAGEGLRIAREQSARPEQSPADVSAGDVSRPLPPELRRPPEPEPIPAMPLAPSRPDVPDPPGRTPVAAEADARRRGRVLHRLLELLPQVARNRREHLAQRLVRRATPELAADAVAALVAVVLRVLDHGDLAPLFGPEARAEVPIVGRVGDRLIAGQIDRLVVLPDRVLIVDFKSERRTPPSPADIPPAYLRQMAAYRAVLRQIYPTRPVACGLLWTEEPRWMPLPDTLLDPHATT